MPLFFCETHNVLFAICNKTSIIKKFEIKMHYDLQPVAFLPKFILNKLCKEKKENTNKKLCEIEVFFCQFSISESNISMIENWYRFDEKKRFLWPIFVLQIIILPKKLHIQKYHFSQNTILDSCLYLFLQKINF